MSMGTFKNITSNLREAEDIKQTPTEITITTKYEYKHSNLQWCQDMGDRSPWLFTTTGKKAYATMLIKNEAYNKKEEWGSAKIKPESTMDLNNEMHMYPTPVSTAFHNRSTDGTPILCE